MDHLKAKFRKKCVPERIQFPEVQTQGQPDPPPPVLPRLIAQNQLPLIFVQIPAVIVLFAGDGPLAAVAADEPSAIGEGVDGKLAIVAALAAAAALRLPVEAP